MRDAVELPVIVFCITLSAAIMSVSRAMPTSAPVEWRMDWIPISRSRIKWFLPLSSISCVRVSAPACPRAHAYPCGDPVPTPLPLGQVREKSASKVARDAAFKFKPPPSPEYAPPSPPAAQVPALGPFGDKAQGSDEQGQEPLMAKRKLRREVSFAHDTKPGACVAAKHTSA